ncbi:YeeE/YedE family protein [bacterium]|jgi:uncharacterized protein|nr:YeeE/YedE family protein [bacterium]
MSLIRAKVNKSILIYGFLVLTLFSYILFQNIGERHLYVFLIGVGLGITLYHASYGFTGGWRNFIEKRDGRFLKSQLIMLGLAVIVFSIFINSKSFIYGGTMIGAIAPISISVVVGSFIFGFAMQLGGGCGSGTLFTAGSGNLKMIITLIFFIFGSLMGSYHFDFWTKLPSAGSISLLDTFSKVQTILMQLGLISILYFFISKLDRNKDINNREITASETVFNLVKGPWPFIWGAFLLVFFNFLMMQVAGHPWSVTFAFGLWGAKIAHFVGLEVESWSYWQLTYPSIALENSVLADPTTVSNIGIILGALIASSLSGGINKISRINGKLVLAAILGGFLMGYGARLAFGCNIGALFGGIASGSLHGWVWFLFAFLGSVIGVKFRKFFY